VIDLHSLRTTLGTTLAREGVAPQIAQRILRHRDYRTTLKHYTVLELEDTSRGLAKVRSASVSAALSAERSPQIYPQSPHDSLRSGASSCEESHSGSPTAARRKSLPHNEKSPETQAASELGNGAGDGDRTHDIQLGKLTLYR
jgi:hypothetical protein